MRRDVPPSDPHARVPADPGIRHRGAVGRWLSVLLLWLVAAAFGQEPQAGTAEVPASDPAAGQEGANNLLPSLQSCGLVVFPALGEASQLEIAAVESEGWIEVTPMQEDNLDPLVIRLEAQPPGQKETLVNLPAGYSEGQMMVCRGGEELGIACDEVYVQRGDRLAVRLEEGIPVSGSYVLDSRPVAGARVAVVPADLDSMRPFTMPLSARRNARGTGLVREVVTDQDGSFRLPGLAACAYRLESVLPNGRVHHSDAFEVPPRTTLINELRSEAEASLLWELGEIVLQDGLLVEFRVVDSADRPIPGALVGGSQGGRVQDLVTYQGVTDRTGTAFVSGFALEKPTRLICEAPPFQRVVEEVDLVPAFFRCVLNRPASLAGSVTEANGGGVDGAQVSLTPVDGDHPVARGVADSDGAFVLGGLKEGEYLLQLAAAGYELEERRVTILAEQRTVLPAISLLPGRPVAGRVVDAETGEGIPGVVVHALEPKGAAYTLSGEGGSFELTTQSSEPLRLELVSELYPPTRLQVSRAQLDAEAPLLLELAQGGDIAVKILRDDGRPCVGCLARIFPGGEELVTGSQGVAVSSAMAPGHYRVRMPRVRHFGSTVVEEPLAEGQAVRVVSGKTALVTFSRQRAPFRVRLSPPVDPYWMLSLRSGNHAQTSHAELDGSYLFERPMPRFDLTLRYYDRQARGETEVRIGSLASPGQGKTAVARLSGIRVEGRFVQDHDPLPGVSVQLRTLVEGDLAARTRTAPDGTFHIPHIAPGIYQLIAGARPIQVLELRRGERLKLKPIELYAGSYEPVTHEVYVP